MEKDQIKRLLESVKEREIPVDEALKALRHLPYEDMGFAHIDHHRSLRQGVPEAVFAEGKTVEQVTAIVKGMLKAGSRILITRANDKHFKSVKKIAPSAIHNKDARTIVIGSEKTKKTKGMVLVLSAGTSDIPVAAEAAVTAEFLGSSVETMYDVGVAGIHRLLDKRDKLFAARVLIVVAGMDGALPSVVGGIVDKPVIAVPTSIGYGASFSGISALLAMLNSCASGIAVVNIDNGFGAGCLAHKINMLGE
ncbi:MAG: nickel pincer cofactor biosynthesis protein LarB [Nitrospirota bacterium]